MWKFMEIHGNSWLYTSTNGSVIQCPKCSNKSIYCDIPGCVNPATEMFDEEIDELYVFPVCLCKKCKEEWWRNN
jgi:hypothetical protein